MAESPATVLGSVLADAAAVAPGTTAVTCDTRLTFHDLLGRAGALAATIARRTGPDDVVAILSENSTAYVEALYGVPAAGRRLLLLNYRNHPLEWAATLERAGTALVLGEQARLDELRAAAGSPPPTLATDGPDYAAATARPIAMPEARDPDATAWLVPTSGTTGTPKLAMLTHRSLLAAARGCATARPVEHDDVLLLAFPLCHVAAYNVIVTHLHARPLVLLRRFDTDIAAATIEREGVTSASLAPTMIAALVDRGAVRALERLRLIGYGSSGIPEPLLRRVMETLPCGFSQGYGLTEASGNCAYLDADAHRAGLDGRPELLRSAGRATDRVELRIVDDDDRVVAAGDVGEIVVRGDQVMAGYLDDAPATAAAIVDGWLHTGDLGRVDDGWLTVVDRKKDVIVTGGENVASREVEQVLHEHPAVREVAVVGTPDDYYGEAVTAVVALHAGATASADDLVAVCRARLAGFKKPRRVVFVDELPKNTVGKIDKPRVRRELAAEG